MLENNIFVSLVEYKNKKKNKNGEQELPFKVAKISRGKADRENTKMKEKRLFIFSD